MDIGVDVSRLEEGMKVILETKNSIYEITAVDGKTIKILGGMLASGEYRFPTPTDAIFIGSSSGSALKENWIGKGTKLEILIGDSVFVTSAVLKAAIESPSKNWRYSMDW